VSRADVVVDYLASNQFRVDENEAYLAMIRSSAEERSEQSAEALGLDWMRDLFYVDARYITAAFDELEARYVTAAGFIGGDSLSDRLVSRLVERSR
jgi:hypothetical protein